MFCWVVVLVVWLDCVVPQRLWGGNILGIRGREVQCLSKWACGSVFFSVWAILVVLSLIVVSMARTKNTGKEKAASSSME